MKLFESRFFTIVAIILVVIILALLGIKYYHYQQNAKYRCDDERVEKDGVVIEECGLLEMVSPPVDAAGEPADSGVTLNTGDMVQIFAHSGEFTDNKNYPNYQKTNGFEPEPTCYNCGVFVAATAKPVEPSTNAKDTPIYTPIYTPFGGNINFKYEGKTPAKLYLGASERGKFYTESNNAGKVRALINVVRAKYTVKDIPFKNQPAFSLPDFDTVFIKNCESEASTQICECYLNAMFNIDVNNDEAWLITDILATYSEYKPNEYDDTHAKSLNTDLKFLQNTQQKFIDIKTQCQ